MGFWEGFLIFIGLLFFFQWMFNWQKIKMAQAGMEEKVVMQNGEETTIWVKAREMER